MGYLTIHGFNTERKQPDGSPVVRTQSEYPYSYDPFVIYENNPKHANNTIYSDRLMMWDFDKHDQLCEKHFGNKGQYWSQRSPAKIQDFLRDWNDNQDLVLNRVSQYCNASNGYPCWRFDFS